MLPGLPGELTDLAPPPSVKKPAPEVKLPADPTLEQKVADVLKPPMLPIPEIVKPPMPEKVPVVVKPPMPDRGQEMLKQARIEFNQTPFDKLNVIRELQAAGHSVMMVGDGLNDAGALQQAEVGIAVVEKVGVFSPASDVIIEAEQLPRLANILVFSRRAAQVVRTGFLLSGLYNIVGVSIAAAGWLSPLVCAVLMPVSSVTVALFAASATQWLARRSFGPGAKRQQRPSPTRPPAPLDLAAAIAFSEVDS